MKPGIMEYIQAINEKWRELESQGYRSGTSWGEPTGRCAIVKGEYPNGKIVGYLNRDLSIEWNTGIIEEDREASKWKEFLYK